MQRCMYFTDNTEQQYRKLLLTLDRHKVLHRLCELEPEREPHYQEQLKEVKHGEMPTANEILKLVWHAGSDSVMEDSRLSKEV